MWRERPRRCCQGWEAASASFQRKTRRQVRIQCSTRSIRFSNSSANTLRINSLSYGSRHSRLHYARRVDATKSAEQSLSQLVTVDEIAVVGKCNTITMRHTTLLPVREVRKEGLRLVAIRGTSSGITDVSNSVITRQLGEVVLVEHSRREKGGTEATQTPNRCPSPSSPALRHRW